MDTRTLAAGPSAENLQASIDHFASISDALPGVTRPGYSRLERQAHDHFAATLTRLGLTVHEDAAGNTIAVLAPSHPDEPAP